MSRVATASESEPLHAPVRLRKLWIVSIHNSTIPVRLRNFEITSQQPSPNAMNINRLFGDVDTDGVTTALSLMNGFTVWDPLTGQQKVSFRIVVDGQSYEFSGGVLNANGSMITEGKILKDPLGGDDIIVEDGTWSAQAPTGPLPETEKPNEGEGRGYCRH